MKIPYRNLHSLRYKTLVLTGFIILSVLSSCTNNIKNVKNRYRGDQGFKFSGNMQSQEFYRNVNESITKNFLEGNPNDRFHYLQYLNDVKINAKTIYLICLVPGFRLRGTDAYSPEIAKELKNIILKNTVDSYVTIQTFMRWGSFSFDNFDNESFETQYFVLYNQLQYAINELKTISSDATIHIIFIGESYGGKISLFFLDQLLENFKEDNVVFDSFITIHSPLYAMDMAKAALRSEILRCCPDYFFRESSDFGFLNVKRYATTFKILGSESLNGTNTKSALENLMKRKISICNFVGTPQAILRGEKFIPISKYIEPLQSIGKGLTNLGTGINSGINKSLSFFDRILNLGNCIPESKITYEIDSALKFFISDQDYLNNSDFVVKTCEITKDNRIIDLIATQRDKTRIFLSDETLIISSPNIIHLGTIFNLNNFRKDLSYVSSNLKKLLKF